MELMRERNQIQVLGWNHALNERHVRGSRLKSPPY
jgi:hypothetical protein